MKLFRVLALAFVVLVTAGSTFAAEESSQSPWSQRAANAAIGRWPGGRVNPANSKWDY
jgi:hypothetical protein